MGGISSNKQDSLLAAVLTYQNRFFFGVVQQVRVTVEVYLLFVTVLLHYKNNTINMKDNIASESNRNKINFYINHRNQQLNYIFLYLIPFMQGNMFILVMLVPLMASTLLSADPQRYTLYGTVPTPANYTNFFYSDDMTLAMLYSNTSPTVSVFAGYNWTPITDQIFSNFTTEPNYISYFWSKTNQEHNFLSGDGQGQIVRKYITVNGSVQVKLWTVADEKNNVVRTVPSPDQQIAAVFCEDSNKVYILDLNILGRLIQTLSYNGTVTAISWRDSSNQLAIAGGSGTSNFFLLYDYNLKTEEDLSFLTDSLVLDVTFSPDGKIIYFIQEASSVNQTAVGVYDFSTQKSSVLVVQGTEKLTGVSVRGNYVSAWDQNYVYVWRRANSEYEGRYQSKLNTNGLSPEAGTLVTLTQTPSYQLNIYSLCPNSSLYNPTSDGCLACQAPCEQCFLKQTQCATCITSYYLTSSFTCQLCSSVLPGCTACLSSSVCRTCNQAEHWVLDVTTKQCRCASRYVNLNNKCEPCIKHCLRCNSTSTCQVCDINNYYTVKNQICVCKDTYFQSNDTCLPCYTGCLTCKSTTTCEQCYTQRNWEMKNGRCQCKIGYAVKYSTCFACKSLINYCQLCESETVCTQCMEGYELDEQTRQCKEISESNVLVYVLVGVAVVVVLAVGGFFLLRYLKNRKQGRSLLESEGQGQTAYE